METRSLTILDDARCSASGSFCDHCQVRDIAFCAAMRDGEINELSRISHHKNYQSGEIIYDLGDKIERYANIIEGTVKLTKLLADGRQQIIGFLFPGDFIGKLFTEQHSCYVEAVSDVHLCSFPQADLGKIINDHPEVNKRLFLSCARSLERAEEWMLLLGRKTALEKLASFIMLLSARNGERGLDPDLVQLPMSRADIADFLGLTIETVSRQITKLKTQQNIRLEAGNNIAIVSRDTMEELAGLA
jgi:CRP/FNR family transcriptional regulator